MQKEKTHGNDAAFAKQEFFGDGSWCAGSNGLTKREYFAVMAMQGLAPLIESDYGGQSQPLAIDAVYLADALIEALNT